MTKCRTTTVHCVWQIILYYKCMHLSGSKQYFMYEEGKNIAKRGGGEGVNVYSPSPLNAYS